MQIIQSIQNSIYEIRGERVMLDYDLTDLYEAPTKVLNQAGKTRLEEHDVRLNSIYDALENLPDEKAAERKWQNRDRTGFKR